tara:strand:- start:1058 stop:1657 length:600 start_codon:yes stop_codon:yes gene_type:complete
MLKKEFKKKDVNRMRNLITGNKGNSSETQIGYKKKIIERKEGDIWTENKKTWTIKNGIKKTISKLSTIRKETFMPLCCPKCSKVMKKRLDKPNYRIHKMCYDCVIDFEGKLKITPGKWEKYMTELELKNKLSSLEGIESSLMDLINTSNEGYISEKGELERWVGGIDKISLSKNIKEGIKKTRNKLEKELNESKSKKFD